RLGQWLGVVFDGARTGCGREPGAPAFEQFQAGGGSEGDEKTERERPGQVVGAKTKRAAGAARGPGSTAEPVARDGGEATVVEGHEPGEGSAGGRGEGGGFESAGAVRERFGDDAEVVEGEVEPEGQGHELVVAHVVVFVQIDGAEP